ncbi:MAG: hypothetical protein AVW06_04550 [Hadesarchaea archaeon DG-33-1]|nr:MAG: hypothetical protein AVW06_04550 [Hadesarchaea archaeon DG-33-1]
MKHSKEEEKNINHLLKRILEILGIPAILSVVALIIFFNFLELELEQWDLFQMVVAIATASAVLIIPITLRINFYQERHTTAVIALSKPNLRKKDEEVWEEGKKTYNQQTRDTVSSFVLAASCAIGSFITLLIYIYTNKIELLTIASIVGLILLISSLIYLIWPFLRPYISFKKGKKAG